MMIPTEVTTLNIQAAASNVAFLSDFFTGAIVKLRLLRQLLQSHISGEEENTAVKKRGSVSGEIARW